ncbi:MAG: hypothetical protein LUC91_04290, partial [Prevotella sp.]|nr:hypothetical protein [Prevotella sp.]
GELDGVCSEFNEDGTTCVQTEYSNGKPLYDYYVMSNSAGQWSKVSFADGKPIYENPSASDMKLEYINDLPWISCENNGINLGVNFDRDGLLFGGNGGGGYKTSIIIVNNSMFPIDISSDNVSMTWTSKKGNKLSLKVYSFSEFSYKEKRVNETDKFLTGVGEFLMSKNAGKSVSQTTSAYVGTTGSGRTFSGTTASVTTSFDATAAYQAWITASNRIAAYGEVLDANRKIKEEGYLKKTTLQPGETIVGYVVGTKNKGSFYGVYTVNVEINGLTYTYNWDVEFNKNVGHITTPIME